MKEEKDNELVEAIADLEEFVEKMTGTRASSGELAFALSKYFVRKEILEFISLYRKDNI